jgi:hypothetical protein
MRLYPDRVRGVDAGVTARCLIDANGNEIIDEKPAGKGFGTATIKLSKLFQMKAVDDDGEPVVGSKLTLPVRWYAAYSP